MSMGGGRGAWEINLSFPSGIIHGHLIVLVRHKLAQICVFREIQNTKNKFYEIFKIFYFKKFSAVLLISLMHSFKVAENWLQLQLCSFGKNA